MIYVERITWAMATVMLVVSGLYFTIKLKFVQFKVKDMFTSFKKNDEKGICSFKSLMMTLGARIGVGSLAGIALAIYYGGVGSIFWIWVSTIICSANAFSESLLGVKYRKKDNDNYVGGPSYYIEKGLKKKFLGKVYAIALVLAYTVGFLTVQSNAMVRSITEVYRVNPIVIAVSISILTMLVIFKGLNRIANFSAKLVPFMVLGYVAICLYIIIFNIDQMSSVISLILRHAFNPPSMTAGIMVPIIIGFQRGTFSNEAGLGTGAIASATTNTNSPSKQGFVQVFGIYIETLVLSSLTAFVIILSNYDSFSWHNINGIELTQKAFVYHLGNAGNYVIMISILLFAFSTIITGYYYGESSLKFLHPRLSKSQLRIFKILIAIILIIGGVASSKIIWSIADILIVVLGIINVYSLLSLRKEIIYEYEFYKHTDP